MRALPMCYYCERSKYNNDGLIKICEAYPDGIPQAVLEAGHFFPKPGDNGIQFKGNYPFSDGRTEEDENKGYDEEVMTDKEYLKKYGEEKPKVI